MPKFESLILDCELLNLFWMEVGPKERPELLNLLLKLHKTAWNIRLIQLWISRFSWWHKKIDMLDHSSWKSTDRKGFQMLSIQSSKSAVWENYWMQLKSFLRSFQVVSDRSLNQWKSRNKCIFIKCPEIVLNWTCKVNLTVLIVSRCTFIISKIIGIDRQLVT